MPIKGAVVFVLVSNSGVKDGLVDIYRPDGKHGNIGTIFLAELQAEMKAKHIPHSVTIPFPDNVEREVCGWFEANPDKLEKVVVICSSEREKNVARGISADLPVMLWVFDGRHEPETSNDKRRYFSGVYPRENFPENDGATRMLAAMEEERQRSFFAELNAFIAAEEVCA